MELDEEYKYFHAREK